MRRIFVLLIRKHSEFIKNKMDWRWFIGGAAATGIGLFVAVPLAITAVGFTGAGVAAGSVAAGVQAGFGNVAAGSVFAALQSAGAAGVVSTTTGITTSAATGAVVGFVRRVLR